MDVFHCVLIKFTESQHISSLGPVPYPFSSVSNIPNPLPLQEPCPFFAFLFALGHHHIN